MPDIGQDIRPLHILIPADLHARLKAMAEANDRSMAAETRRALEDRLQAYGPPEPASTTSEAA